MIWAMMSAIMLATIAEPSPRAWSESPMPVAMERVNSRQSQSARWDPPGRTTVALACRKASVHRKATLGGPTALMTGGRTTMAGAIVRMATIPIAYLAQARGPTSVRTIQIFLATRS